MENKLSLKNMADRPRERLMAEGAAKLSNSELLAIIISSGTREENAVDLANKVLSLEENVSFLSNYSPEEYMQIRGIGIATACKICASVELGKRICSSTASKVHLGEPCEVAEYFSNLRHLNYETLKIALFNTKMELIKVCDVSMGGLSTSYFEPRDIFSPAIRAGAVALIMVHNHPSGHPAPSDADVRVTKTIMEAGKLLGIKLIDHIIIGDGTYCSLREESYVEFL